MAKDATFNMPYFHLLCIDAPFIVLALPVDKQEWHSACAKPAASFPNNRTSPIWITALVK